MLLIIPSPLEIKKLNRWRDLMRLMHSIKISRCTRLDRAKLSKDRFRTKIVRFNEARHPVDLDGSIGSIGIVLTAPADWCPTVRRNLVEVHLRSSRIKNLKAVLTQKILRVFFYNLITIFFVLKALSIFELPLIVIRSKLGSLSLNSLDVCFVQFNAVLSQCCFDSVWPIKDQLFE